MPKWSDTIIDIGGSASFDLQTLIDTRLLIQANSGAGKSWAIRRILEQSHGRVQQIVLDLEGEFSTLREKYDYVLAGKDGDIAAEPKTAGLLARKLMELRVSAICDLYELKAHERILFVRRFLEKLISSPRKLWHPVLVVIDEAHHFCPEKGQAESAMAVIDLATRGRKRGLCAILASQRISRLNKSACAELLNKMIGRTSMDIDQRRAADELGFASKSDRIELRNRRPGQFWVYGPALKVAGSTDSGVVDVRVGPVQTVHPKVGTRHIEPPAPTAKIKAVLGELVDLPTEAKQEADKLVAAKTTIRSLRAELVGAKGQPRAVDRPELIAELNLLRGINKAHTRLLTKRIPQEVIMGSEKALGLLQQHIDNLKAIVETQRDNLTYGDKIEIVKPVPKPPIRGHGHDRIIVDDTILNVPSSHRRILDGLAGMESIGRDIVHKTALAAFIGMSSNGGAFNNYLGWLRSNGFIEYRPGKMVAMTDDGRATAEAPDTPVTLAELHERCLSVVANSHKRILRVLLDRHPEMLSKPDLAAEVRMTDKGGAFNNYLGKLRTLGMVEYPSPGHVRASDLLFPEGLT